jgi:hypothetical protein
VASAARTRLGGRLSSGCYVRSAGRVGPCLYVDPDQAGGAAVGALLGFGPIAAEGPGTLAELGFDYAAGPRTIDPWFSAPPMFVWDCPGCGQRIADHGPAKGPVSDQDGHTGGCVRLAAEAANWEQQAPP